MKIVSIIIPYYNRPLKLERTLKSIYAQTYNNFEVIVIDDCSEIAFENKNYNLTYVRNQTNLGPGASRNIGKNLAKGDYIVFLDSDDYYHEDFLKKAMCAFKENPDVIMVYTNGYYVNENGIVIEEMRKAAEKMKTILPTILLYGRPWGTGACVWCSRRIQSLQWSNSRCWEDYDFDVSAALICNDVAYVNDFLVFYDQSDASEKLSNQSPMVSDTYKNMSLKNISKMIYESSFFNDELIRNRIILLTLNNTISLVKQDIKEYKYYKNNIQTIRIYKNLFVSSVVYILTLINKKLGLRLIRRLRQIL